MTRDLEAKIQLLEDIEEIKKVQRRYALYIDTKQPDKILELFADDGIAEYSQYGVYRGEEIRQFMYGAAERSRMMSHHMLNPLIEVNGDTATGFWSTFGPYTLAKPEGDKAYWIQGRYHNEYVKVNGQWKFKHLKFKLEFQTPFEDGWVKISGVPT